MIGGRHARRREKALERVYDVLVDEYDGDLPGLVRDLDRAATDEEIAQAMACVGGTLLAFLASDPPSEEFTARAALGALKRHPQRVVVASEFLGHALVRLLLDVAELSKDLGDTGYPAVVSRVIGLRALGALGVYLPIAAQDEDVLDVARARLHHAKEVLQEVAGLDVQAAVAFRRGAYQMACATHALDLLVRGENPLSSEPECAATDRGDRGRARGWAPLERGGAHGSPRSADDGLIFVCTS